MNCPASCSSSANCLHCTTITPSSNPQSFPWLAMLLECAAAPHTLLCSRYQRSRAACNARAHFSFFLHVCSYLFCPTPLSLLLAAETPSQLCLITAQPAHTYSQPVV